MNCFEFLFILTLFGTKQFLFFFTLSVKDLNTGEYFFAIIDSIHFFFDIFVWYSVMIGCCTQGATTAILLSFV